MLSQYSDHKPLLRYFTLSHIRPNLGTALYTTIFTISTRRKPVHASTTAIISGSSDIRSFNVTQSRVVLSAKNCGSMRQKSQNETTRKVLWESTTPREKQNLGVFVANTWQHLPHILPRTLSNGWIRFVNCAEFRNRKLLYRYVWLADPSRYISNWRRLIRKILRRSSVCCILLSSLAVLILSLIHISEPTRPY